MGIYLGQLPPAEVARFKAELAETLIANFCYPRFFDYRTESLQMRPVDRAKRQEVWLYLSSVDFTAWSRIDLMSPEFQHQIERLFIQFVQRNRAFFGDQGRRRMSDIRMLISSNAASVSQGLRNHLRGQKASEIPFGSPRPVISWAANNISGRVDLSWEQISASTMLVQQQLQDVRGEVKQPVPDGKAMSSSGRRTESAQASSLSAGSIAHSRAATPGEQVPVVAATANGGRSGQAAALMGTKGSSVQNMVMAPPVIPPTPAVKKTEVSGPLTNPSASPVNPVKRRPADTSTRRSDGRISSPSPAKQVEGTSGSDRSPSGVAQPVAAQVQAMPPVAPASARPAATPSVETPFAVPQTQGSGVAHTSTQGQQAGSVAAASTSMGNQPREMMSIGEDDIAIFEQMRHQLILWLRIEALSAGVEIAGQGPAQLLDLLRQNARVDETRIQVVSTLLNLSNQVIKTGLVSVLDYKQALMFHLMHTRR
ncbi:MAG TPA: hypothetical protein VL461_04580 [Dictyobacter sp.]|jgi:hypothetical protein|nr:hypothetical protein [Dictyobacter sp.]